MPALSTTCPLSLVCLLTNELLNKYRVIMQMSLRVDLQFYVYLAARIVASLETTSGLSLNNSSTILFTSSPVNGLTSRLVFLVSVRNSGSVRVFMNALRRIWRRSFGVRGVVTYTRTIAAGSMAPAFNNCRASSLFASSSARGTLGRSGIFLAVTWSTTLTSRDWNPLAQFTFMDSHAQQLPCSSPASAANRISAVPL